MTDQNIWELYAQADALLAEKLLRDLTDHIIEVVLTDENAAHFYQFAIEFKNAKLLQACADLIVSIFDSLVHGESREFFINLPMEDLVALLQSSDLRVESESTVVSLVRDYLAARVDATDILPMEP